MSAEDLTQCSVEQVSCGVVLQGIFALVSQATFKGTGRSSARGGGVLLFKGSERSVDTWGYSDFFASCFFKRKLEREAKGFIQTKG
jgi:hypothetical protein